MTRSGMGSLNPNRRPAPNTLALRRVARSPPIVGAWPGRRRKWLRAGRFGPARRAKWPGVRYDAGLHHGADHAAEGGPCPSVVDPRRVANIRASLAE